VKRILIPTNDPGYVVELARAYARLGWEPTVGSMNFRLGLGQYDCIHFLWPEEFTSRPPKKNEIEDLRETLSWWAERSRLIASVQNFYPHGYEHDPAFKELYNLFYSSVVGIVHHSEASREMVNEEFPITTTRPNVVTGLFRYDHLLKPGVDRTAVRREFGYGEGDFVILVFGAVRKWAEAKLVMDSFAAARIPNKRLLLACRFNEGQWCRVSPWSRRTHALRWKAWIARYRHQRAAGFIPDEEVWRYLEAADVVVVPRLNDLSSGLVPLGMTFGKILIAPNHGAFPEYLGGTQNPLYRSGDARSLARAIEQGSRSDRKRIGEENRRVAAGWSMDRVAKDCLCLAESAERRQGNHIAVDRECPVR
jgi:glycosyltransferase involved in cell wall biosynthesis